MQLGSVVPNAESLPLLRSPAGQAGTGQSTGLPSSLVRTVAVTAALPPAVLVRTMRPSTTCAMLHAEFHGCRRPHLLTNDLLSGSGTSLTLSLHQPGITGHGHSQWLEASWPQGFPVISECERGLTLSSGSCTYPGLQLRLPPVQGPAEGAPLPVMQQCPRLWAQWAPDPWHRWALCRGQENGFVPTVGPLLVLLMPEAAKVFLQ